MFVLPPRTMDLITKPRAAAATAKESVCSLVAESGEGILGRSASHLNKDEGPFNRERGTGVGGVVPLGR